MDAGRAHGRVHEHAQAVRRPIASFQALRHRIADVKMQFTARSMSYYATLGSRGAARGGARSRRRSSSWHFDASSASSASSWHGGIGVTDERG
jgi:alkylation response protein AidB-like acyl-CoA dehydrogenase